MKIQNLRSLGTDYNIIDDRGQLVKVIKIVKQEEILDAAIGTYIDNMYMSADEYIDASSKKLSGFAPNPNNVYWHKSSVEEFDMMAVIDACLSSDFDYAILELVPEDTDILI